MATAEEIMRQLEQLRAENKALVEAATASHSQAAEQEETTGRGRKAKKMWRVEATVYNQDGTIAIRINKGKIEELHKGFDKLQEADQWSYNRLCGIASGSYAVVSLVGTPIHTKIERDTAMDKILGNHKAPTACHTKSTKGGSLGFQWKVHETRVEFSRG